MKRFLHDDLYNWFWKQLSRGDRRYLTPIVKSVVPNARMKLDRDYSINVEDEIKIKKILQEYQKFIDGMPAEDLNFENI